MARQRWSAPGPADREGVDVNDSSKAGPQAIPTRYAGYHFRSRLEARWAVFFDALGWEWEYEPEGFDLPSGRYLPDFRVDFSSYSLMWVEVKGVAPSESEWLALKELCASTNQWGLMLGPIPRIAIAETGTHRRGNALYGPPCKTCTCVDPYGSLLEIFDVPITGSGNRNPSHPWPGFQYVAGYGLQPALDAARSARFEHGHSGAS